MCGTGISFKEAADIGWHCMQDEWAFNRGAVVADARPFPSACVPGRALSNGAVFVAPKEIMRSLLTCQVPTSCAR